MNITSHAGDDYTRKTAAAEPSAADEARQEREERRTDRAQEVRDWQCDFRNAPFIWYTMIYDRESRTKEPTGNFYETEEAARKEMEFRASGGARVTIHKSNIHSLELATRRWSGFRP